MFRIETKSSELCRIHIDKNEYELSQSFKDFDYLQSCQDEIHVDMDSSDIITINLLAPFGEPNIMGTIKITKS